MIKKMKNLQRKLNTARSMPPDLFAETLARLAKRKVRRYYIKIFPVKLSDKQFFKAISHKNLDDLPPFFFNHNGKDKIVEAIKKECPTQTKETINDADEICNHIFDLLGSGKVKLGKEKIKEWTGKYPITHRAGGYGINEDTFKALSQVEMPYDSSYFYGNGNCKFQYDVKNKPFRVAEIVGIPITVFKKIVNYKFLNCNILHRRHFQKLDRRYGAAVDEIKKVVNNSDENDIIVLFLHSFNFLNLPYNFRRKEYGTICVNEGMIKDFDDLLKWISLHKKSSFTTIDRLRVDCSHDDICIEIPSMNRCGIKQKIFDSFANRILKVRRT